MWSNKEAKLFWKLLLLPSTLAISALTTLYVFRVDHESCWGGLSHSLTAFSIGRPKKLCLTRRRAAAVSGPPQRRGRS